MAAIPKLRSGDKFCPLEEIFCPIKSICPS
jgi:hypothetical protein